MAKAYTTLGTICAVLGIVITPTPASAYNIKTLDNGQVLGWAEPVVSMRLHPDMEALFSQDQIERMLGGAAGAWAAGEDIPEIVVVDEDPGERGYHRGQNHNGIYHQDPWDLEEWGTLRLAVTVTTYSANNGELLDTDQVVNGAVAWTGDGCEDGATGYDFGAVMTHEMGHVLGLSESDVAGATMWPTIRMCDTDPRFLSDDDLDGVSEIYALTATQPGVSGCGGSSVASSRQGVPLWFWAGLLFAGAAFLLFRRENELRPASRRSSGVVMGLSVLINLPIAGATHTETVEPAPAFELAGQDTQEIHDLQDIHGHGITDRERLHTLLTDADAVFVGEASRLDVEWRRGILRTRYRVEQPDGSEIELEVPGGRIGDIVQQVGEEAAPSDGDILVVAPQTNGRTGWTRVLPNGELRGGWLGEGPAIDVLNR